MQYKLSYQDGIFEIRASGDATLQGYFDYSKATLEHEEWKPGSSVLIDISELNTGPLKVDEVREIAHITGQYREQIGNAKIAVVVKRELEFGMSRLWELFIELEDWGGTEMLFREREAAVLWLKTA